MIDYLNRVINIVEYLLITSTKIIKDCYFRM